MRSAAAAFAAFALNPPGWIPAWISLAFVLASGWMLQAAALSSAIELARVTLALEIYKVSKEMYVTTLSIWLGYRGLGGIVEAFRAVRELRSRPAATSAEASG